MVAFRHTLSFMVDERIDFFRSNADRSGVFLDFDGTLSEIVHVPSEARPVDGVREVVDRLAERFSLVAIVSGRSSHQLVEWLGSHIEIWGVHGAERTVDGSVVLSEFAAPFAELMARVRDEAQERLEALAIPGTLVEDKGVMIGLHFRAAEDVPGAERALDELAADLAERHGLLRAGGRLAFELRPPHDFSKAAVVLERARQADLKGALFIGDDRVDLPAFDALDILATEGVTTLRVAVDSAEAPDELLDRADVVLEDPRATVGFLEALSGAAEG